jgi:hypothetical protein
VQQGGVITADLVPADLLTLLLGMITCWFSLPPAMSEVAVVDARLPQRLQKSRTASPRPHAACSPIATRPPAPRWSPNSDTAISTPDRGRSRELSPSTPSRTPRTTASQALGGLSGICDPVCASVGEPQVIELREGRVERQAVVGRGNRRAVPQSRPRAPRGAAVNYLVID